MIASKKTPRVRRQLTFYFYFVRVRHGCTRTARRLQGVMLCNRPFAAVAGATTVPSQQLGAKPSFACGAVPEKLGSNIPIISAEEKKEGGAKAPTALARHKKWLQDLQSTKESLEVRTQTSKPNLCARRVLSVARAQRRRLRSSLSPREDPAREREGRRADAKAYTLSRPPCPALPLPRVSSRGSTTRERGLRRLVVVGLSSSLSRARRASGVPCSAWAGVLLRASFSRVRDPSHHARPDLSRRVSHGATPISFASSRALAPRVVRRRSTTRRTTRHDTTRQARYLDDVESKEERSKKFMAREAKMRALMRAAKAQAKAAAAEADDAAQDKASSAGTARGGKPTGLPMWALTEGAAEAESEAREDEEADELLDFARGLDYDKYMEDVEVRRVGSRRVASRAQAVVRFTASPSRAVERFLARPSRAGRSQQRAPWQTAPSPPRMRLPEMRRSTRGGWPV